MNQAANPYGKNYGNINMTFLGWVVILIMPKIMLM